MWRKGFVNLYWRIRKRAAVENVQKRSNVDLYGEIRKRAGVDATGKGLIQVNLSYDGYARRTVQRNV